MRRLYPGPADTLLPKRCSARALVSVADKDVAPSHAGRLLAPGGTPERVPQPHQAEPKQRVTEGDHHLNPDRRRERDYGFAKGQQDTSRMIVSAAKYNRWTGTHAALRTPTSSLGCTNGSKSM